MKTIKKGTALKNGFSFDLPDGYVIIPFSAIIAVFRNVNKQPEGKIEYLGTLNDDHSTFVFREENLEQFDLFFTAYITWLNKE